MQYNMPQDILDLIRDQEKRISNLERLVRSGNTSIDNGALIVKKGDQVIGLLGDLSQGGYDLSRPDGTPQMGFLFYRDDGTIAFSLYDDHPTDETGYHQFVGIWDRRQYPIIMEDYDTGYGLARPFIPGPTILDPDVSHWTATVNGSFVGGQEAWMFFENPAIFCDFMMFCDTGTSGEARLMINNVQYGPTISGGAGYSVFNQKLLLDVPLIAETWYQVRIDHRRTGGAGNVRSAFRILYGMQSRA